VRESGDDALASQEHGMTSKRLSRILSHAAYGDDAAGTPGRLCRACVEELGVSGAALAVVFAGESKGTFGVSDELTAAMEDLQFTLGEGPSFDAASSGQPVLEPRLAESGRWPVFGREAAAVGVAAAFGIPLTIGAASFGSLDLYRDQPGPLPENVLADATVVAGVAAAMVRTWLSEVPLGPGAGLVDRLAGNRAVVHQAAGMLSIQLGMSLAEALVALRARSYAASRSVGELATDIVSGALRFDR
jgi:hypothetical protein